MPNLTPIPLSEEERERLMAVKHKLEANSWREMLMKLCDIYEEQCKTDQPVTPTEQDVRPIVEKVVSEKLENMKKSGGLKELLIELGKGEEEEAGEDEEEGDYIEIEDDEEEG